MTTPYGKFQNDSYSSNNTVQQQHHHNNVPLQNVVHYGYDQNSTGTTVIQVPSEILVEQNFSWVHFIMSIITFFLSMFCFSTCSFVFSLLGMIYSANSYSSHGEKAYEKSRRQNSTAKVFWIISMVCIGICAVFGIIALVYIGEIISFIRP